MLSSRAMFSAPESAGLWMRRQVLNSLMLRRSHLPGILTQLFLFAPDPRRYAIMQIVPAMEDSIDRGSVWYTRLSI